MYLNDARIPKIQQHAEGHQHPPQPWRLAMLQPERYQEITGRSSRNQRQVKQVPFGIEEVVRKQDHGQRERAKTRQRPVEEKNAYQENEISGTGENHENQARK